MLQVYDRVLGSGSEATLVALSALVIFLFLAMGVLEYARGKVMAIVGARFQERLDRRVFTAATDDRTGASYFRTEVAIDAAALKKLGDAPVVPGMPVDVFTRTSDRTPLSYLLKPLTDYFRNAFRET
jgi:ATP-binding cassette subfamily C protein